MFGCGRSNNAHIERKKSKMSYVLDHKPTRKEEKEIESRMNELIADDLPVTYEFVDKDNLPQGISVDKLPGDVSQKVRLVRIMTCVHASASMCAQRRRSDASSCSEPTGMRLLTRSVCALR